MNLFQKSSTDELDDSTQSRARNKRSRNGPPKTSSPNLDYFHIDEFDDADVGEHFMAVMPVSSDEKLPRPPREMPAYLTHLWKMPILTRDQEFHCFRKMNYLKYLAGKLSADLVGSDACRELIDDRQALHESIDRNRNFLVESNLRLVISIAKRHAVPSTERFEELICIGNVALLRAVELFDFRRGTRFTTYAYQAIERSIYGLYQTEKRHRAKSAAEGEYSIEQCVGDAGQSDRAEQQALQAKICVASLLDELDDRDREIVLARFGINRPEDGLAFHRIAKRINLSTTRTVQRFNLALERMQGLLLD